MIAFGLAAPTAGGALDQGRSAAREALSQIGKVPPALVLVSGVGSRDAEQTLSGVREVLGDCPLVGLVGDRAPTDPVKSAPGVRLLLVGSQHVRAKVGVGAGPGWSLEQEVREAFRSSFIGSPVPGLPDEAPERKLYSWYLYRHPSLVLALVISHPGELRAREAQVAAYLRRRLQGRTPFIVLSHVVDGEGPAALADRRVVTSGVVLTVIKTELKFAIERFHSFEPLGVKLFVTRADVDRIRECNGRPAFEAYRDALGLGLLAKAGDAQVNPFSLYPLAYRSRDGRFNLLVPEQVEEDGSLRFSSPVEADRVLYPMKAVTSPELWRAPNLEAGLQGRPRDLEAALVVRDARLRDLPSLMAVLDRGADGFHPVEISCDRELRAQLPPGDGEGVSGHLLLTFQRELEPFAVAAAENERLFTEVVRLKDLHQKIFDSIGYGIAVIDGTRRVVFSNNTYQQIVGAPATAPVEGGVCPWSEDRTAVCASCAAAESIASAAAVGREVVRVEEGKSHWYRLDTFPLRDGGGAVTATIEVIRDVTAFKDLGFSLESEQRKMEAVLRGMGETLYIVNRRFGLQFFHRGAFPVVVEHEEPAGRRLCYRTLFHRDMPCPWCRVPETVVSGRVERSIAHFADEGGEEGAYQITFSPWGAGQGDEAAVVCLLVDISSQKRLEQQMIFSEKLHSLAILSAGMAHELNNPLGAISFNIEILKRHEKDREYQEVLESIRKDVLRINRIVGNLLSFSRSKAISSGRVSLSEVIDASLELFQVVIEGRRIEVRRAFAEALPPVWGNAQDLQQVFVNLIANAVDAMPSGGVIDIAAGLDEAPPPAAAPAGIAVVYDDAGDLASLRALVDVPGWEVRFFRGDEEAIDFFRQRQGTPPDVLLLDYADANQDRVDFSVLMMKECAPEAMILVIDRPEAADRRVACTAGIAAVLPRPLVAAQVIARVSSLVAGLQAQRPRDAAIVVRFRDTGVGIPPKIQERIFDPFFTTKETRGTGLGLSVVHKILENHGASISVDSAPGKGATFTLAFPQAQPGPGTPFRMEQGTELRGIKQ